MTVRQKLAGVWAVALILSATFLRQLLEFVVRYTSRELVIVMIWGSFFALGVAYFLHMGRVRWTGMVLRGVCFCALLLVALSFDIPEERMHLVKYGLLGYLAYWPSSRGALVGFFRAVGIALVVASIDETVQYFLPYRYGDLRDVGFGVLGGAFGATFAGINDTDLCRAKSLGRCEDRDAKRELEGDLSDRTDR
ncbi:VanZ family protein [bacterium]|nr:VanZ family protein [bacterium]